MADQILVAPSISRTRSGDFRHLYANSVQTMSSFWDVGFVFAQVIPAQEPGESIVLEERAMVSMSWEQARAFHEAIGTALKDYERIYNTQIRDRPKAQPKDD